MNLIKRRLKICWLTTIKYTQSPKAKEILSDFNKYANVFVKVMPLEYKRILEERRIAKKADLGEDSDG